MDSLSSVVGSWEHWKVNGNTKACLITLGALCSCLNTTPTSTSLSMDRKNQHYYKNSDTKPDVNVSQFNHRTRTLSVNISIKLAKFC